MTAHNVIDDDFFAVINACLGHAKALLDSAKSVKKSGHHNIAYHLAALSLEEIGRMELVNMKHMACKQNLEKDWLGDAEKNHVKKLFWCLFSSDIISEEMTPDKFEVLRQLSLEIHDKRLAGLYVGQTEDGLKLPSEQITPEEAVNLIHIAETRISLIGDLEAKTPTQEEISNQTWFLKSVENIEKRNFIFSKASMEKLHELSNARDWANWLKLEFKIREDENSDLLKQERARLANYPAEGKLKWKVKIRIFTTTHTLRPSVLREWNNANQHVQLKYVNKKNCLDLEIRLNDDVSIDEVYWKAFNQYTKILLALNIASMGIWFSETALHIDHFYDELEDLENKSKVSMNINGSKNINEDEDRGNGKRVFDRQAMTLFSENILSLPDDINEWPPLKEYMKGIVLLSKHNVHFKCEVGIFSSFLNSLFGLMLIDKSIKSSEDFEVAFSDFYTTVFPDLDEEERFISIIHSIGAAEILEEKINIDEALHMKLYCDAYFLNIYKTKIFALAKNIMGDSSEGDIEFSGKIT